MSRPVTWVMTWSRPTIEPSRAGSPPCSAPANVHYQHNDFRIRTHHMHDDESPNGHSHCLQFLLGTSETVPIMDGDLQLGEWQRIFLVELDGPRPKREVLVQVVGVSDDLSDAA